MLQVVATVAYHPPVATTLSSEHIMLKMAKLEFENHKNQYFSWLLRSEHVKINIFGNCMTKLTILDLSEVARF